MWKVLIFKEINIQNTKGTQATQQEKQVTHRQHDLANDTNIDFSKEDSKWLTSIWKHDQVWTSAN
jgi:hypothetical protein